MKVAPQPASLLLAGRHDGNARSTQLGGQADPTDGEAERSGQLGQHALVTRPQRRAVLPADDQSADHLVALLQLDDSLVRGRWAARRLTPPAVGGPNVDRHRVEAKLALQAGGERRQQLIAGVGADVVDHAAHDLERVVAGTPDQAGRRHREYVAWPARRTPR